MAAAKGPFQYWVVCLVDMRGIQRDIERPDAIPRT